MQDELPTVTVAIVAHNSGKIIGRCIQSLEEQNYPKNKYDILVVDDSKDESTIRICAEKNLKYLYAPETDTPGKARNVALNNISAEIVAFIDTDCIATTDWLNRIVNVLRENTDVVGVVGWFSGGRNWLQKLVNKEHVKNLKEKGITKGFLEGNCAFRTKDLNGKKFGIFKYAEGVVLSNQLAKEGLKILTDYDLRVVHYGFSYSLRKFFRMGQAHYYNVKYYFGDRRKSNIFSIGIVVALILLLISPLLGPLAIVPALFGSAAFIIYAFKWHRPIPIIKIVPAYLYFIAARWLFWIGYFTELLRPKYKPDNQ